jgi:SAM-dependent methyltransferase
MPPRLDLPRSQRGPPVRVDMTETPDRGSSHPVTEANPVRSHVVRNREVWTGFAADYAERAPRQWATEEIDWGIWDVPESGLQILGDVAGLDVLELGCGTAYFSSWLARRGARPVGLDVTPDQLRTAREMQDRFAIRFPLVEANAEAVPLRDERFDLVLSEYGASIWCDPYEWVPEAARLLRPAGRLIFLCNTAMQMLTTDELGFVSTELRRDYFRMHRFEWPDDHSVEFHLGHGDWIRLLRSNRLEVHDLVELQAPPGAIPPLEHIPPGWAERWPSEEIWIARKMA